MTGPVMHSVLVEGYTLPVLVNAQETERILEACLAEGRRISVDGSYGPFRVRLSRRKGWRKPPNTVVVSRPSKWGNPYRIIPSNVGGWTVVTDHIPVQWWWFPTKEKAIASSVEMHRRWIINFPHVSDLAGKNLACWCPLDQPCHADVLLELANAGDNATGLRSMLAALPEVTS